MAAGALGRLYSDGEVIFRQGETGACMYEILAGEVEILDEMTGTPVRIAILGKGDFFGEMAIFQRERRSATVRARGEVRALTIDKRNLMRRIGEDPTLALRLLERLSGRIRDLDARLVRLREAGGAE